MTQKLCECGCGEPTALITRNNAYWGMVKGEYRRFIHGHFAKTQRLEWSERLWRVTDCGYTTPCFVWLKVKDRLGYGRTSTGLAHRRSYEEANGPIPAGLTLDHLCRNPSCVRPDHLEAVTHRENLLRGAGTKLTYEDAEEIRKLHVPGTPLHDHRLAAMYGVHPRTIYQILRGAKWIQDPPTSPMGIGY